MVQQFLGALFTVRKGKTILNVIKLAFVIIFILITVKYGAKDIDTIKAVIDMLVDFSGIFSAILITYIISKMVQIREERLERKKDITILSNKLTNFRRIAEIILGSYNVWNGDLRRAMQSKYKYITLYDVECGFYQTNNLEVKSLLEELSNDPTLIGNKLYLDLRSLVNNNGSTFSPELYGIEDKNIVYPVNLLEEWVTALNGNYLWYCLIHEGDEYEQYINITNIDSSKQKQILELCKKVNHSKYAKRNFDKDLLADIGNDFNSHFIPNMYELVKENTSGLPNTIIFITNLLYVTIIFGLMIPLLVTTFHVPLYVSLFLINISVTFMVISFLYIILVFKSIIQREIIVE